MDEEETEKLLNILKKNEAALSSGCKKIVLTDFVIQRINYLMNTEETIDNINLTENANRDPIRSAQLIDKLLKTSHLKIIKDVVPIEEYISLSRFKNLQVLEIERVDIGEISGMSVLRPILYQLICKRNLTDLRSLLEFCGRDFASQNAWNELKMLVLSYNSIRSLDASLESAPWLHTLDLSHNELITLDEINHLVNLKYLNVSFNKIRKLPRFSGQLCNRLQIVNLGNNSIDELAELKNLVNVSELDLSDNCLSDHYALASLSHLATLQWLCLERNPLSYHPEHRQRACEHLHPNIDPGRFVLDYAVLDKKETRTLGTFHPLPRRSNDDLLSSATNSSAHNTRKFRTVDIEESSKIKTVDVPSSPSSIEHLEIKNHVQNLRRVYGESWLNHYDNPVLSERDGSPEIEVVEEVITEEKPVVEEEVDVYNAEDESFENDIIVEGDDKIYIARFSGKPDEILLVLTETTLSEQDCLTGKEFEKWTFDSIIDCRIVDETELIVNFDSLRKDKRQRSYELEKEDAENLNGKLNEIIGKTKKVGRGFKCMRCLFRFPTDGRRENVACPSCDSTIIVQDLLDN